MGESLSVRAIVLAGGRGKRFGEAGRKQFIELGGRPLVMHCLEALAGVQEIREIAIVLPAGAAPREVDEAITNFESDHDQLSITRAEGGERRQDSVVSGLRAFEGTTDIVLVHDAARPFPPREAIEKLIASAAAEGAGLLAARVTDTVKLADSEGRVAETLDRSRLWLAQTPQAFRGDLFEAMVELLGSDREFTDEAAALEVLGVRPVLVESPESNFKITRPEDLARAERWLARVKPEGNKS